MSAKKSVSARFRSDAAKGNNKKKAGNSAGRKKRPLRVGRTPADKGHSGDSAVADQALRESEQKYRALVEQSLQGLVIVQDARIVFANPALAEISGYTAEEIAALSPEEVRGLVHPEDQDFVWGRLQDRLAGKSVPPRYEYRGIRKDGSVFWLEMFASRVEYEGRPAIQGAVVEVTDRKRAEMKVEENERFLQGVFDAIQDGITVRDRDLNVIQTNQWVDKKYATEMPLVGKKCYRVFQKRQSPCPWCPAIPAMETGTPHTGIVPYPSAENPTGWFELTAFPRHDADGNVVGAIEHAKDITERKRAEEALARAARVSERSRALMVVMNASQTIDEVLAPLLETALDVCGMDGGAVYVVEGEVAVARHHLGLPEAFVREVERMPLSGPTVRTVIGAGCPVNVDEVSGELTALFRRHGLRHVYSVPLRADQQVFGFLNLTSRSAEAPAPESLEALGRLALETESAFSRLRAQEAVRQSERRYRALVESSPDAVTEADLTGRITYASPRTAALHGFETGEAMVGRNAFEFIAEEHQERAAEGTQRTVQEGVSGPIEYTIRRKDGTCFAGEISAALIRNADGGPEAFLAVTRDITERKQAEEALDFERRQLLSIFESIDEPVYVSDPDTYEILYMNRSLRKLRGDAVGQRCYRVLQGRDSPCPFCTNDRILGERAGQAWIWEHRNAVNDRWYRCIDRAIRWPDGRTVRCEMAIDITERKRSEELLQVQYELAKALGRTSSLGEALPLCLDAAIRAAEVDAGVIYTFNPATGSADLACAQGLSPEFVAAVSHYDGGSPNASLVLEGRPLYTCYSELGALLDGPRPPEGLRAVAMVPLLHEGEVTGALNVASRTCDEIPTASRAVLEGIAAEIGHVIAHAQAEEALQRSEEKFRGIAERSFDILFIMDTKGNVTYVSPATERILLYQPTEIVGRRFTDFVPESEVPRATRRIAEAAAGNELGVVQGEALRKDGTRISVEINSSPVVEDGQLVGIQGIIRDVTERCAAEEKLRRMEAQLAHVARLSTMGELVAGVVHEVSQPLYSIVNFAKASRNVLTAKEQPGLDHLREWNDQIAASADRAGQIVARLRSFIRRTEPQRAPANINEVVKESVELVAFEARRHRIRVKWELDEQAPPVYIDRVQIQQVLVNVLRNAYEALQKSPSGQRRVTVRTARAGQAVEVAVADNGPGLPPDGHLYVFEPFATTKPGGLGIGLAISRTIIDAHGGELWVTPTPGGGATFHFTLPFSRGGLDGGTRTDHLRRG
jgi:two-component system sensor kinase FixL